jgi:septal ring factor EnvC (AmiA/AmiB activator)
MALGKNRMDELLSQINECSRKVDTLKEQLRQTDGNDRNKYEKYIEEVRRKLDEAEKKLMDENMGRAGNGTAWWDPDGAGGKGDNR